MPHSFCRATRVPRARWLTWLLAGIAALIVTGCAGLPTDVQRKPSTAITNGADTTLGRLVQAAAPPGEPLSGFRLLPMPQFSLHARIELARRAQRSIDVQYYLVQNDETGRYLLRALRDAADRGVRVRLLVDDLYTAGADPLFTSFAAHPNVEVRLFNPFPAGRDRFGTRWAWSILDFDRVHRRMHNKLYVVDNAIGVMGGRNIANEYFLRDGGSNFIDIDTLVAGAVVPRLSSLFDMYWNSPYVYPIESLVPSTGETPRQLRERFDKLTTGPSQLHPEEPDSTDLLGNNPLAKDLDAGALKLVWARAEAYADAPAKALGPTEEARGLPADESKDSVLYNVRRYVRGAENEVLQTTPYLIPGRGGMESIRTVRGNGVAYSIVTNSLAATDESLVHIGYRRYRPEMLRLGVELYELSPKRVEQTKRFGMYGSASGRLHGKSAVIDHRLDELRSALDAAQHRSRHLHLQPADRAAAHQPDRLHPAGRRLPAAAGADRRHRVGEPGLGRRGRHHPAPGAGDGLLVALEAGPAGAAGAGKPALAQSRFHATKIVA